MSKSNPAEITFLTSLTIIAVEAKPVAWYPAIFKGKEDLEMTLFAWIVFIAAAILEVSGDAVIRKGLRGNIVGYLVLGFLMLGCYGVVVNSVKWNFSRLLGVYVAVFAVVSVLTGRFVFKEVVPSSTWIGLAIIVAGGAVIQAGHG